MFGFQRALGSLEAKRASQELKALYPIKVRFSKKATTIGRSLPHHCLSYKI